MEDGLRNSVPSSAHAKTKEAAVRKNKPSVA
jgi:hypothetical protein